MYDMPFIHKVCKHHGTIQWVQGRPWRGPLPYIYMVYIYIFYNSIHVQLYILQQLKTYFYTSAYDTKALLRKLRFKHPHRL